MEEDSLKSEVKFLGEFNEKFPNLPIYSWENFVKIANRERFSEHRVVSCYEASSVLDIVTPMYVLGGIPKTSIYTLCFGAQPEEGLTVLCYIFSNPPSYKKGGFTCSFLGYSKEFGSIARFQNKLLEECVISKYTDTTPAGFN